MKKKKIISAAIWLLVIAGGAFAVKYFFFNKKDIVVQVQAVAVGQEVLFKEVLATGTINPIDVVNVGTQVSGTISAVMTDFNQQVRKGQVLARMDTRNLSATVAETESSVEKADLNLQQAKVDYERAERLLSKGAVSRSYFEERRLQHDNALKNLEMAKQQLSRNRVGLGYATIVSPINGIVISRDVDEGQTVAASFSTPTLFRIANNLSLMKIEASVDEADIGQIEKGQQVSYTVDAFPDEIFTGTTQEVQLQPIVVQNVVTYKVIVLIDNPDLKLIPGMTATLAIRTSENPRTATVTNAAMAFDLTAEEIKTLKRLKYEIVPDPNAGNSTVWVKNNRRLTEKAVTPGFSNGIDTAIKEQHLVGDSLVTRLSLIDPNVRESEGGLLSRANEDDE